MHVTGKVVELRVVVRASIETNDHEVLLFGDEQNLIDCFGDQAIGLDPDDILTGECQLRCSLEPKEVTIGRCDCGVIGCGDVRVRITEDAGIVTWSGLQVPCPQVRFAKCAYEAELKRAIEDFSWETRERTVARFIRNGVDRDALSRFGLSFRWASGRVSVGQMTIGLWLEPGPFQVLVRYPYDEGETPERIAIAGLDVLASPPVEWTDVEWRPQSQTATAPPIAGHGWKRGS